MYVINAEVAKESCGKRTEYKLPVFIGKDGEDYHLRRLRPITALSGKNLLKVITYPEVITETNREALSILVPSYGVSPLQGGQSCELSRGM